MQNKEKSYELILLAAGQGQRMQADQNKILLPLANKPIIFYTLIPFLTDNTCKHIILVIQEQDKDFIEQLIQQLADNYPRVSIIELVVGGKERQDSVCNGLQLLNKNSQCVLIHDGARPFITHRLIHDLYEKTFLTGAAILGVPVKDTIKKVSGQTVIETIPRETLWQVQTPQAFTYDNILAAHQQAKKDHFFGTDDASLVEHYQGSVTMVVGSYENIKLTTPEDLFLAELILKKR